MNASDPGSNITFTSHAESITPTILTATTTSPTVLQPPSPPSIIHEPELTILVVLGLSLLLAGLAAFLAVCRRSETEGDSESSCTPGERLTPGKTLSSEPQLKTWRRLGSYRRSYNLSFRRPPYRRPQQLDRTPVSKSVASQTPQPACSMGPHITTPCLLDYVTEI